MKPIIELMNTPRLCVDGRIPQAPLEAEVYSGWLDFEGKKYSVIFGYNETAKDSRWEHVSISHMNKHRLPDWETMCRVKEMFWGKDVTVVQFHPAEDAYLHGVGTLGNKLENVLHLWRPKDGDWSAITEELLKAL